MRMSYFLACSIVLLTPKGWAAPVQPQGFLYPKNPELVMVKDLVEKSEWALAQAKLDSVTAADDLDLAWSHLLKGLTLQGINQMDASLLALTQVVSDLKKVPSASPDRFRVAGYALKKIGFYYRQKGDFEKAYGEHSIELSYFKAFGSADEIHDALISLDNDAYGMKDYALDAIVIAESIRVAETITNPNAKFKSLGMSWNNYAQTLPLLKRFSESAEAAQKSIGYYSEYESLAGMTENYLVWAYTGLGSVLQLWMNDVVLIDQKAAEQKLQEARQAYDQAFVMAQKRGITGDDLKQLQLKIECLAKPMDQAVNCPTNG